MKQGGKGKSSVIVEGYAARNHRLHQGTSFPSKASATQGIVSAFRSIVDIPDVAESDEIDYGMTRMASEEDGRLEQALMEELFLGKKPSPDYRTPSSIQKSDMHEDLMGSKIERRGRQSDHFKHHNEEEEDEEEEENLCRDNYPQHNKAEAQRKSISAPPLQSKSTESEAKGLSKEREGFEYSRKPRAVSNFTPYTLQQYKLIKPKEYIEYSKLAPGI